MKKRIVLWIALAVLVSAAVCAQQYDPESDFEIERVDNGRAVEITGYLGNRQTVRIPPSIQGLPVTGIGYTAFTNRTSLTSVIIPNSVTSIGYWAFRDCTSLTSVIIGNSVTSIGWAAFSGCTGLISIIIPNSVTNIEQAAFYGCTGLTSVTIPNSVTSIGNGAFSYTGLSSITIPNSVTDIGYRVFSGCTSLTVIRVAANNPNFSSEGGVLYNKEKTELLAYPSARGNVIIPNSVTGIGNWAFTDCENLTGVTIPNSVTSIGDGAFIGCTGLISITIPNSVTSIGKWAFYDCGSLTAIQVASGNPQFSAVDGVLYDKAQRTLIQYPGGKSGAFSIPNSVTSIEYLAFAESGLTSVIIGNSVTSIGSEAFRYTDLASVTIPNSVTSIEYGAFFECYSLTSVTFGRSDTAIAGDTFPGDLEDKYASGGAGTYETTTPVPEEYWIWNPVWTKR